MLESPCSSWLGVALQGDQCFLHLCWRIFFCFIDACVSLYHTRNASCDMFKLAGVCLHRTKNATIDILKKQGLGGVRDPGELEGGIGNPGIGVSAQAQKVRCMCTL